MPYIFRGHLCGIICDTLDYSEDLSNARIRLYRVENNPDTMRRVAADAKDTIAVVNAEQIAAKQSRLLAEATTDEAGKFEVKFDDKYDGEAFEMDVYLTHAPHQKKGPQEPTPIQFTITVLQPKWRQTENGFLAVFDFCIPGRFWCALRARLGAWVILGRLLACDDQTQDRQPLAGYTVRAFDKDWLQDDPLGAAVTNASGFFRIDYLEIDFKQTFLSPWLNIETLGSSGPDVYFRVERSDGAVVLAEDPSRGTQPDRANRGPCFCVELCVKETVLDKYPYFTHIGLFEVASDLNPDGKLNKTRPNGAATIGGSGWGLMGAVRLVGYMPKVHPANNQPLKYRFLWSETEGGTYAPITKDMIDGINVATRISIGGGGIVTESVGVVPDMSTPGYDVKYVPDDFGWVPVDQPSFFFNGNLIRFKTTSVVPGGNNPPHSGAGNPVAAPQNGQRIYLKMEAVDLGEAAMVLSSPSYPAYINNWREVSLLALQELAADACAEISTDTINIQYTTDHELMAAWSMGITSSATGFGWTAPTLPSGTTPRGANGTETVSIAGWPSCTYRLSLATRRMLTNGDLNDDANTIPPDVMFYIQN